MRADILVSAMAWRILCRAVIRLGPRAIILAINEIIVRRNPADRGNVRVARSRIPMAMLPGHESDLVENPEPGPRRSPRSLDGAAVWLDVRLRHPQARPFGDGDLLGDQVECRSPLRSRDARPGCVRSFKKNKRILRPVGQEFNGAGTRYESPARIALPLVQTWRSDSVSPAPEFLRSVSDSAAAPNSHALRGE